MCVVVFRTAWEQVAQALWRRYPNPYSKHVLSEDLVSRYCRQGRREGGREEGREGKEGGREEADVYGTWM